MLDLESWASGSILTGGNILLLFFGFHVVKTLMPILAFRKNSTVCLHFSSQLSQFCQSCYFLEFQVKNVKIFGILYVLIGANVPNIYRFQRNQKWLSSPQICNLCQNNSRWFYQPRWFYLLVLAKITYLW